MWRVYENQRKTYAFLIYVNKKFFFYPFYTREKIIFNKENKELNKTFPAYMT